MDNMLGGHGTRSLQDSRALTSRSGFRKGGLDIQKVQTVQGGYTSPSVLSISGPKAVGAEFKWKRTERSKKVGRLQVLFHQNPKSNFEI